MDVESCCQDLANRLADIQTSVLIIEKWVIARVRKEMRSELTQAYIISVTDVPERVQRVLEEVEAERTHADKERRTRKR